MKFPEKLANMPLPMNMIKRFLLWSQWYQCIPGFDETVYKNNIPNNELEKWLKIEKERFSEIVLRLFHTELESVYRSSTGRRTMIQDL